MGKGRLRYYYGTMNSLKSGTLLTKAYQFQESGCHVILLKPSFDTRDKGMISSRAITKSQPCYVFDKDKDLFQLVYSILGGMVAKQQSLDKIVVFVDEVNFITPEQVEQLWRLTRSPYKIDVFTYGLKNTYLNEPFPSSQKLFCIADTIEEIKSMCSRCLNKATTHLRFVDDKPVFDGETCIVGDVAGTERYESVCTTCWYEVYWSVMGE